MARLACPQGHLFRDEDQLRGLLLSYEGVQLVLDRIAGELATLVENGDDRKSEWIGRHFNEQYPKATSARSVVRDFVSNIVFDAGATVYECPECHRLLVFSGSSKEGLSYLPEGRVDSILRVLRALAEKA